MTGLPLKLMVAGAAVVAGAGLISIASGSLKSVPEPTSKALTYWAADGLPNYQPAIAAFAKSHGLSASSAPRNQAEFILTTTAAAGSRTIRTTQTGAPVKLESGTIVAPTAKPTAYLTVAPAGANQANLASELAAALAKANPDRTWKLDALGDIIIGRDVYLKMLQYDPLHPFENYTGELQSADLTIADLENAFSDSRAVITPDGMTFISPSRAAAGLKSSGIDAVNVANNHSFNAGPEGYLDTLATLDSLGVAHFGGGKNATEAHTPYITTVKGTKIAMLGYSSIVGSSAATASTPGMAYLDMAPWGTLNDSQVQRMEADIRAAKARADLVLVYYHWGTEYTHDANADQRAVAHRAIDAGADVILGTHPHWVQGVEWYHNRLITYSLGNFIFDQEWSNETKQGTMLQVSFDGATIAKASLAAYTISDYNQPAPAAPNVASSTLTDIFTHSWWPK